MKLLRHLFLNFLYALNSSVIYFFLINFCALLILFVVPAQKAKSNNFIAYKHAINNHQSNKPLHFNFAIPSDVEEEEINHSDNSHQHIGGPGLRNNSDVNIKLYLKAGVYNKKQKIAQGAVPVYVMLHCWKFHLI